MASGSNNEISKVIHTTISILETIQNLDGANMKKIAEECNISEYNINQHLDTLIQRKLVAIEEDEYVIGLRFIEFGKYAQTRNTAFEMAAEKVNDLAKETNERAQFIVEEHGQGIYVHREIGQHAIQTDPGVGKQTSLHATAAGKAILAHLPDLRVKDILGDDKLPALTSNTITNSETFHKELEKIRKQGYSLNREENIKGLHAVATPVLDPNNRVIGALSVSGPKKRMRGDRFQTEIPELLMGVANEIEVNLKHINKQE